MFPGQQGATCPAQLWPPRPRDQTSGGGAKYGKVRPRGLLSDGITKNRCSQPSFCTIGGKRQSGLISTLPPLYFRNHLTSERRAYFRLAGQLSQLIFAPKPCIFSHILPPYTAHQAPYAPRHSRQDAGQAVRGAAQPRRARLTLSALDPVGIASFAHFDVTGWSYWRPSRPRGARLSSFDDKPRKRVN